MKIDWWLTGFCATRAFGSIVAVAYAAALPVLQQEWFMSAAAAGSVASGYQMGYAVSLIVFSWLADRLGPKPLYEWSMSAAALCSLTFALLARDHLSALLLYTLVGISLGGTYTTGLMILADRYPVQRRGTATGFFIASTSFGCAFSLVLSGIAIPIGGYKLSFLLTCSGPLVAAILSWITLRNIPTPVAGRQKGQKFATEVLTNKSATLLIGGYTCHTWELLGMRAWTPAFLAACLSVRGFKGLHATGVGSYITAVFYLTALLAAFTMGSLSDRLGRARVIMMVASMSTVCSFVFGWTIQWPFFVVMAIGLIYAFSTLGDSPVLSAALTEVVSPSYLGAAFGLRSLVGIGAGAISPLVFGAVLDWTNPVASGQAHYPTWGWAFSVLGIAGFGAVWAAYRFEHLAKLQDKKIT